MLNFGGLGIAVEYEDDNAGGKVSALSSAVDGLWGGLQKMGRGVGKVGTGIGMSISKMSGAGRGAVSAINGIIEAASSPQLDHAYSSMYAGFNKSFSAMTVGMKTTAAETKKAQKVIGSAAFGLNEDMEGAAKSWAAFAKQGISLENVLGSKGLKGSMKDLIRVTSVFGIEGEQLATVTSGLVRGFNFTEEQVGSLADKLYLVGKQFDAGQESIQAWPAIFEALNNELADFGKNLSPKEIEKLTLSVVQLGGGLSKSLGIPAQSAMEIARTAFTTLAGERKNIVNMFRGMGGEFGEVAKQLQETGGDTDAMFRMMAEGDPLKFMDTLREMAKVAEEQGGQTGIAFQRLSGVMSSALGSDVAFAAKGNWDKVQETMAGIPEVLAGSDVRGSLSRAAKLHHKTGLTAGESWDRTVEGMKAKLFGLTNKDMRAWQKNMKKGFDTTFDTVSKLAKADGPVGELTKRFLAVQRVGLSALIPGLESMAPLLGGVASSMVPVMTAVGSMGLKFGSLGKMALGGGAIWGFFEILKKGPKQAIADIKTFGRDIWNTLGDLFPELEKEVGEFFDDIASGKYVREIKKQFGKIDFEEIFSMVGGAFHKAIIGVEKLVAEIDWEKVVRQTFNIITKVSASLGGFISALVGGTDEETMASQDEGVVAAGMNTWFMKVLRTFKKLAVNAIGSFWDEVFTAKSVGDAFGKIGNIFVGGLAGLLLISKTFRGKFIGGIKHMMTSAEFSMVGGMKKIGRGIKTALKAAGPLAAIMAIVEALEQAKVRGQEAARIMADTTVKETQKAALASEQAFMGVLSTVDSVLLGLPSSIGKALGVTMDDLSSFYHDMVAGFETGISAMVEFFSLSFNNVKRYLVMFGEMFVGVWNWLGSAVQGIVGEIMLVWKKATTFLELKLNEMGKNIETTFMAIGQYIMYPFKLLGHKLKGWMSELLESILGTSGSPTVFGNLLKKFDSGMFDSMLKTVRTMRVEYKMEGGEQFDKKYFEESEKQRKAVANRYEQAAKRLKDELAADETRAAITAAKVEASQKAASREISDALVSAARDTTDNYDRANKNVIQYSEDAYRSAAEAATTSKRLRNEAEKEEGLGVVEEAQAVAAKPKPKRKKAMSPKERAELARPKDPGVRALMENVSTLTSGMSQFVQKPLNVNVSVQGDVGKFMRFNAQHERKHMPSAVSR